MQKRKDLLEKHEFAIWQGNDGKWRTHYLSEDGKRLLIKRNTKYALEDAIVAYIEEREENPPLCEVFKAWNDRRLEIGQISAASHLRYGQDFDRYYGPIRDRKVKSITADELCDFMEQRAMELNLTRKAFVNFRTITKGLFKRAYRRKMVPFRVEEEVLEVLDLSEGKFKTNRKEDYQEVFSEEEYRRYLEYLRDNPDKWNMALLLILVTGLRGGEVVALTSDDLEWEGDFFVVKVRKTETRYRDENGEYIYTIKDTPKTEAGIRKVIVPKQFSWIYRRIAMDPNDEGYLFNRQGRRLTTNSLRRRQERNCKKLGFYHKSPHKGRKTYGTILLDSHLDDNVILQQMGHADLSTTERFYHRNMKDDQKKADIISGIDIFSAKERKID
jgi:integrase